MALNHILYRPQVLKRSLPPAAVDRIPDEALEMASRLLADGIKGGRALTKAKEGMQEALDSIIPSVQARFGNASQSARQLLEPVVMAIQALGSQFSAADTPAEGIRALASLLLLLADLLENLSADAVEAKIKQVLRIITDDLGFSRAKMTEFINDLIDKVVQKMKQDFIMGDQSEQSHNEYLIGAYLEKLKRVAEEQIADLELQFDIPKLALKLSGFLRNLDWDRIRLAAAQVLEDIGKTAESLAILFDIFSGKFTVSVEVTVSARTQPGGGGDFDPVSWYATYFERKFGWTWVDGVQNRDTYANEEPWATRMSFRDSNLSPKTMEQLAHWSDVAMSAVEAFLQFRSIQEKDISANVTNGTLKVINGVLTTLLGFDNDASWVDFYKVYGNWWVELLSKIVTSLLTGIESSHKCTGEGQGIFWITLVGKDLTESLLYDNWTSRLRQFILSLLTLINSDPIGKPGSQNHNKVVGFTMAISELFSWILATFSGRQNFGFPAHGGAAFFWVSWIVGGLVSGALAATAGTLFGWLIAHSQQPEGTSAELTKPSDEAFGLAFAESMVASLFKHPVYNYLIWSGDTDGGKFGQDTAYPTPNWKTMKGYGPKETSPYRLPYPSDVVRQCAQGNLGPWSHNANTNQVYAYDWDHDHGMEVLAVREGSVSSWHDVMPDHTTLLDNNLKIRHDLTLPDPAHDLDWTDEPVLTTANYIHGAHFGIRQIFGAMGIPTAYITGTPVSRGMLVMFSGDTGMSFYNHLHMHVSSPNSRSIPWVFGDPDAPENGVLKDLIWYKSANERVADPTGINPIHVPEHQTVALWTNINVVSTGAKTVVLDFTSAFTFDGAIVYSSIDNIFKDCALIWTPNNGPEQVIRIESHKYNKATAKVEMNLKVPWNPQPAAGQKLKIETRAGVATTNTIILDAYARANRDDIYANRFIKVIWKDANGDQQGEYKKIASYNSGEKKVTIVGNWSRIPDEFANVEIGGKVYDESSDFNKRFAFIPGGAGPAPGFNIKKLGRSYLGHRGLTSNLSVANKVTLGLGAPATVAEVVGRFIVIYDGNPTFGQPKVLGYRKATAYDPLTREVTLNADWGVTFSGNFKHYEIGNTDHATANADNAAQYAFICKPSVLPDNKPGFDDVVGVVPANDPNYWRTRPYNSRTFKTW